MKKGFSLDQSFYDYQVSAGTAFGYFRLTSDSFSKNDKPYLKCDDNLCAKIQKNLKAKAKGSRIIGVSWFRIYILLKGFFVNVLSNSFYNIKMEHS